MDETPIRSGASNYATHEVLNQTPPLEGHNLYREDRALQEAVAREGADWAAESLERLGATAGRPDTIALGRLANAQPPILQTHDRNGVRRDEVEFHPAYHELMTLGFEVGAHSGPWAEPRPGAHTARAATYLLYGQIDSGTQCPMTMTYAAAPVLAKHADALSTIKEVWLPRIYSRTYDRRFIPVVHKAGATIGMGMTEKQGGSDVRSNTTRADPIAVRGPGRAYRITGHKWFLSAPMSDAFLVLAQAPGGLSCFLLPRLGEDGSLNRLVLQRLKDKLGNRSNASAEVELQGATAWLLGDEGRGVVTILEMVNYTRLDCATASAALMRQALTQALHHASHRTAFGDRLLAKPLMQNVLADLALESEAATVLALRLARAYDRSGSAHEVALRRLLTPAAKYWICKRSALFAAEAMEVLGGNGYVEESILPRIYREAPVNSIWEGSGNVMCLDVLRVAERERDAFDAYFAEMDALRGSDTRLDTFVQDVRRLLSSSTQREVGARLLTEKVVLATQAALLVQHAPQPVAEAFCASRLAGKHGGVFGTLPTATRFETIIERAWPAAAAR